MSTAPTTTLHYAPNANFADGGYNASGDPGSIGFNLADVDSQAAADALPNGVMALMDIDLDVYTVAQAESIIAATANDPKVWGYYVADEPADSLLPSVKTVDDYIARNAPGKESFFVAENDGTPTDPVCAATPSNTDADLIGLDPYPIRPAWEDSAFATGYNYSVIPDAVQEAEGIGWRQSQIVPVYQAFGGGSSTNAGYQSYTLPTAAQEEQILATWATLTPKPAFDYAYSWGTQDGDSALVNTPSLQAVFQQLFSQDADGKGTVTNAPTITVSGPAAYPLATSGHTALVGLGVTTTDSTDQLTVTLSDANDALVVDGKNYAAGTAATLTGTSAQIGADLSNVLAGSTSGTLDLTAVQAGVTQTAAISLATVGTPSMTFSYEVDKNESVAAPAAGSGPIVYDIGRHATGTLTVADFRKGTDVLQFSQGVTLTSTAAVGAGLELNLSNQGHVLLAALS